MFFQSHVSLLFHSGSNKVQGFLSLLNCFNWITILLTFKLYILKILGIIPARYQSARFPGKPLADIAGKTMIQRVYEQCIKAEMLSQSYCSYR